MKKNTGILAIQGSFAEHANILDTLKIEYRFIKTVDDMTNITHLIIPGGESTTMKKNMHQNGLWNLIEKKIRENFLKIFGTCAGMILCRELGMPINIKRNAYGAQQNSFTTPLLSKVFPQLDGIFIRAPQIQSCSEKAQVLAYNSKTPVLIEWGNFLVASFHPELAGETRIHKYFLER